MRIPFLSLANRLTGFSTPIFGVSWNPPALDVDVAKEVVARLEDRRVLFAPHDLEIPAHAASSVVEIRHLLSDALTRVDPTGELGQSLRAMRSACRKFLDDTATIGARHHLFHDLPLNEQWQLGVALGELRAIVGIHLGQIVLAHGIDVEQTIAALLPPAPDDAA